MEFKTNPLDLELEGQLGWEGYKLHFYNILHYVGNGAR